MAYGRFARGPFKRGLGRSHRVFRAGGQFTPRMRDKVRNAVRTTQPFQRRVYIRTPPIHKKDKPFVRWVRIFVDQETTLTYAFISSTEAAYYNQTQRWNNIRVRKLTFYGRFNTAGNPEQLVIVLPNEGQQDSRAEFTDIGDGQHRATVAIEMPPTIGIQPVTSGTAIAQFGVNSVEIVDALVEFS